MYLKCTFLSSFSRVTILSARQCGGTPAPCQHHGDQLPTLRPTSGPQHRPNLHSSSMMTMTMMMMMTTTTIAMTKVMWLSGMMLSKLRVRVVNNNNSSNSMYNNYNNNNSDSSCSSKRLGKCILENNSCQRRLV